MYVKKYECMFKKMEKSIKIFEEKKKLCRLGLRDLNLNPGGWGRI
jgi:hypothetical protein